MIIIIKKIIKMIIIKMIIIKMMIIKMMIIKEIEKEIKTEDRIKEGK